MTCNVDHDAIHLYEAQVPTMFLTKFAQPDYAGEAGVIVKHKAIPFEPHDNITDRLSALLLDSGIVNCSEESGSGSQFTTREYPIQESTSLLDLSRKRKHKPLLDDRPNQRQRRT